MPDFSTRKSLVKDNYISKGVIPSDQLNRIGRMLNNISGENGIKVTVNTSGIRIQGSSSGIEKSHFKVEANASSSNACSMIVRGGEWIRELEDGVNEFVVPLECDTGVWDENWNDTYKSISLPNNTASYYIYLKLDDCLNPSNCAAKVSSSWPTFNDEDSYVVIAKANAGSHIIEQYFSGDIYDRIYARTDASSYKGGITSCSIELDANHKTQLYNFPDWTDTPMVAGDLVVIADQNGGVGGVPGVSYTSKVLSAGNADYAEDANNASHADFADVATYANTGPWPTTFDHPSLTDRNLSDSGGHAYYWAYTGWRNPDTQSYATDAEVTAGKFIIYGGPQYWNNVNMIVDVTGNIDLDSDDDITINSVADMILGSVNYYNCTTGTILTQSFGNNTTQSTGGWVTINGSAGVEILSTNSVSVTATDDFTVDAGNVVDIHATNSLTISAQALRAIVLDSDIDLQTSGELQINGVPGVTDNTLCLTDPSNGDLYTATFTKGLLTSLVAV